MSSRKKHSRAAKRMERHYKRQKQGTGLNLVALMDIFTILVFFLLVNSSSSQQLQTKAVDLPKSIASQLPRETLVVMVNGDSIVVQGRKVADVKQILRSSGESIAGLKKELLFQAKKTVAPLNEAGLPEREITILGDKEIPYALLQKIMITCSENEYSRISLAVMKNAEANAT